MHIFYKTSLKFKDMFKIKLKFRTKVKTLLNFTMPWLLRLGPPLYREEVYRALVMKLVYQTTLSNDYILKKKKIS